MVTIRADSKAFEIYYEERPHHLNNGAVFLIGNVGKYLRSSVATQTTVFRYIPREGLQRKARSNNKKTIKKAKIIVARTCSEKPDLPILHREGTPKVIKLRNLRSRNIERQIMK
jgi:hypothetical protein